MDEILGCVSMLAQDQYGNYVIQVSSQFSAFPLFARRGSSGSKNIVLIHIF